jgi:hypothetical protein
MKTSKMIDTQSKEKKITIRKFDLNSILPDAVVVIVGRRRSGKSWLVREMMSVLTKRGVPYGKVYSGTEHCNPFFEHFFPKAYISTEFKDSDLEKLIESQRKKVRRHAKEIGAPDGRCLNNNMLLVFDDMISQDSVWKHSKQFKKLFTEGRHYNINFYLVLQVVLGIPPAMRENLDYVFLFSTDGSNLKKLWENYAGVIDNFKMFRHIFDQCTCDKGCMVIDKTSSSQNITDKVFFYKSEEPEKFKFGCQKFWKLHDERYVSDDESESDDEKLSKVIESYGHNVKKYQITVGGLKSGLNR